MPTNEQPAYVDRIPEGGKFLGAEAVLPPARQSANATAEELKIPGNRPVMEAWKRLHTDLDRDVKGDVVYAFEFRKGAGSTFKISFYEVPAGKSPRREKAGFSRAGAGRSDN